MRLRSSPNCIDGKGAEPNRNASAGCKASNKMRNMALFLDGQARDTLLTGTSVIYGYQPQTSAARTQLSPYDLGTPATSRAGMDGTYYLETAVIKDAVETLSVKNVPRLGETYVGFIHPHQSRRLRDDPTFYEVTKYAAPGRQLPPC